MKGFPLWGKLSPQVTDEGATAGHFPLIRRVPRHLPPKGKAFAAGWGHPALRGDKNHCAVGAGHCPARDFTAIAILRVIRRGGIYAARCNRTNIAIQRANRTGRIYASPTNQPEVYNIPIKFIDSLLVFASLQKTGTAAKSAAVPVVSVILSYFSSSMPHTPSARRKDTGFLYKIPVIPRL